MEDKCLAVRCNNTTSDVYPVQLGVLQGSALGPTLFIMFVNDLPKYINSCHITICLQTIRLWIYQYQVLKWFFRTVVISWLNLMRNRLVVRYFFTKDTKGVDEEELDLNLIETKFLGIFVDSTLSWIGQIDQFKLFNQIIDQYCKIFIQSEQIYYKDTLETGTQDTYKSIPVTYSHSSCFIKCFRRYRLTGGIFYNNTTGTMDICMDIKICRLHVSLKRK